MAPQDLYNHIQPCPTTWTSMLTLSCFPAWLTTYGFTLKKWLGVWPVFGFNAREMAPFLCAWLHSSPLGL